MLHHVSDGVGRVGPRRSVKIDLNHSLRVGRNSDGPKIYSS